MNTHSSHPYHSLPDSQFWSRSVATPPFHEVDPLSGNRLELQPSDKIATIGSCFAQHLSRHLTRQGMNYLIAEAGPEDMPPEERRRRNYGVFSARYGNVYTVRQAVQLLRRAYGEVEPSISEWSLANRYVDPFRPQVEPDGFATPETLRADRKAHLTAVRSLFEQADLIVFTLGLTEAWQSRRDGIVVPVVPGASGGVFDPTEYEFVNFGFREVLSDLEHLLEFVRSVNGSVRFLLTVSPVPLIASYSHEHVLAATTYSKSVLRAVAGEVSANHEDVYYFPSFEIITGLHAGNTYFESDLRSVSTAGVDHVMRSFMRHHVMGHDAQNGTFARDVMAREARYASSVVCDEEVLDGGVV